MRLALAAALAIATPAAADPARALDVLPLDRDVATAEASYEHSDHRDGLVIAPGGRIAFGDGGFLDGALPIGWVDQVGRTSLGNFTATLGLVRTGYLSALAIRLSAPTSPSAGAAATTVTALATPRVGDAELFLPGTTSAEALADGNLAHGSWRLQLELGLAGRWQLEHRSVAVARGTVAATFAVAPFLDVAASFVTRAFVIDDTATERFVHAVALGAIAHARCGELALRLEVPIDASARLDSRFLLAIEARGR